MAIKFILIFCLGFISSILCTGYVLKFCLRHKLLDKPDKRKIHYRPLPCLGGIAVCASFIFAILFAFLLVEEFRINFSPKLTGFILTISLIVLLGLWDDLKGLNPFLKLLCQISIALILFYSGFRIEVFTHPFTGEELQLPFLASLFLGLFWIVGLINAINLIDGLDGSASGIVGIASLFLLSVAIYLKTSTTAILFVALAGSCLGFLRFNFPPAKIFLGDVGSMFLGLILAIASIVGLQYKAATAVALLIPLAALAIPIEDTFLAIIRRLSKKKSIFIADKKHLHHRLLDLGLTQRQAVLFLYLTTIYFGIIAFLFVLIPNQFALLLLILLGGGTFAGVRTIGFIERKVRKINKLERRIKRNGS